MFQLLISVTVYNQLHVYALQFSYYQYYATLVSETFCFTACYVIERSFLLKKLKIFFILRT